MEMPQESSSDPEQMEQLRSTARLRHQEVERLKELLRQASGEQSNGYGKIPISVPLRLKPQSVGAFRLRPSAKCSIAAQPLSNRPQKWTAP
jgi:hypothetical protein